MNASPETPDLEVILRFLHRFADLMSTGSNSENLLRAATLLEANVTRANEAEEQLRQVRSNCARVEQQLALLSRDGHVHVPISILRLAASNSRRSPALSRIQATSFRKPCVPPARRRWTGFLKPIRKELPRSRIDQPGRWPCWIPGRHKARNLECALPGT